MSCSLSGAVDRPANSTQEPAELYCDICKAHFKKMSGLVSHLKGKAHLKRAAENVELLSQSLHYDEWICDICRETFLSEDGLTIHQLTECKKD